MKRHKYIKGDKGNERVYHDLFGKYDIGQKFKYIGGRNLWHYGEILRLEHGESDMFVMCREDRGSWISVTLINPLSKTFPGGDEQLYMECTNIETFEAMYEPI